MVTKQKMIRFLVPLEDASKLELEAKKLNLSDPPLFVCLSNSGVMALNLRGVMIREIGKSKRGEK